MPSGEKIDEVGAVRLRAARHVCWSAGAELHGMAGATVLAGRGVWGRVRAPSVAAREVNSGQAAQMASRCGQLDSAVRSDDASELSAGGADSGNGGGGS